MLFFGVVRPFVVDAFYVPSDSMSPTLEVGDRILVNKFVYHFAQPERGDIVVFESVEGEEEDLVKRLVGVPGDEVAVSNGIPFVNGERWEEPYVNNDESSDGGPFGPTEVPEGKVFVMGDNPADSRDSRSFGVVPTEQIKGKALAIFWPPDRQRPL